MRRIVFSLMLFSLLPALGLVACSSESDSPDGSPGEGQPPGKPESNGKGADGKAEAWNARNNPSLFQLQFNYKYSELKQYNTGRAQQTPWPSDYWSYYQDSINVRYHGPGELSPVEKWDKAFNNWTPNMSLQPLDVEADCSGGKIANKRDDYYAHLGPAAAWQHKNKGNWAARNGVDDDGDGQIDECGGKDFDGIETWWGLCHAWTPAAILEAEPLHPVTVNGVEFTVSDIKALLIAQYDRNSALMLGGRCNEQQVERDASGRVKKTECRDANPGAFYVVMTNMLGRDKRALAEDRTFDFQVWNQPILGYRITVDQELTEEQALQKLGKTPADGKYATLFASPEAVAWRYVRMSTDYISESANTVEGPLTPNIERYTRTDNYQMIIELNKEGNVVGGEWIGYSNTTHPDFLWLPLRGQGGNPKIDMAELRNLVEMSRTTDAPPIDEHIAEFGGPADVQIPDNNPSGVTHTITIDQDVTIGSLKAQLNIEHSYVGDLRVVLVKDGTEVVLHDRTDGSGSGLNEVYPVRQFNGQSARGTWTLKLSDHAEGDTGKLVGFKLIVGSNATASTTSREYTNSTAEAIPDGNALGIASVINVSDPGTVKALKVNVNITHPYIGDLVVSIKHGGSTQVLHANEGGSADNIVKSFTVTSFNGSPLNGEWKLQVIDSERQDKGTLNSWSLTAEF